MVSSYFVGGHMPAPNLKSAERRRIVYHKVEVESVWHSWLAIPDDDEEARETFRNHHRERVQQIEAVRSLLYFHLPQGNAESPFCDHSMRSCARNGIKQGKPRANSI